MRLLLTSAASAAFLSFLACTESVALSQYAEASAPVRGQSFSCEVVRFYVARYGMKATEKWARDQKWPKEKIADAKSCLR
jgi:hypothetical protein